jgi:hypothetical protein
VKKGRELTLPGNYYHHVANTSKPNPLENLTSYYNVYFNKDKEAFLDLYRTEKNAKASIFKEHNPAIIQKNLSKCPPFKLSGIQPGLPPVAVNTGTSEMMNELR